MVYFRVSLFVTSEQEGPGFNPQSGFDTTPHLSVWSRFPLGSPTTNQCHSHQDTQSADACSTTVWGVDVIVLCERRHDSVTMHIPEHIV